MPPVWTPDEDAILLRVINDEPMSTFEDMAKMAAPHIPDRPVTAIASRIRGNVAFYKTRTALVRKAEAAKRNAANPNKTVIEVALNSSTSWGSTIVPVSIPSAPFEIEPGRREESRPYERRVTTVFRRRNTETTVAMLKRILIEEMGDRT